MYLKNGTKITLPRYTPNLNVHTTALTTDHLVMDVLRTVWNLSSTAMDAKVDAVRSTVFANIIYSVVIATVNPSE